MQYVFGSGLLYAQPDGADTGAVTPMQVGALRGVSVDMGFNAKDLHGGPWPLAIGRGTGKIACKAEYAQLTADGFNLLFFGGPPPDVGSTRVAVEEPHVVTANAIVPAHAATFELDLGIVAALPAGDLYRRVESAPGPREYTCNESTGAYGFGGSDGQAVLVSYAYADASNGRRIALPNRNIGHTPRFSAVLTETFNGKAMTLTLNSCAASKLGWTGKTEDFTIPSFSFSAAADDAGIVGSLSLGDGAETIDPATCEVVLLLLMGGANGSTTFTDLSGANNVVTAFGSAAVDVVGIDQYLLLPGDLSYLSVAHSPSIDLSGTDFTIEAIVNVIGYSGSASPLFFKDAIDNVSYPSYGYDIVSDGRPLGIVGNGTGNLAVPSQGVFGTTPVGLGADRHVALTRKGSTLRVFNGGTKENTAAQTVAMVDGGKPLLIGWEQNKGAAWYSNMRVKAVRITRCCLYENDFTPPTTFPVPTP